MKEAINMSIGANLTCRRGEGGGTPTNCALALTNCALTLMDNVTVKFVLNTCLNVSESVINICAFAYTVKNTQSLFSRISFVISFDISLNGMKRLYNQFA